MIAGASKPDLLWGVKAIAIYLDRTPRQVTHLIQKGELPTFKLGGTVCSTKSGLANHFASRMGKGEQIRYYP
jgi:hypothetical protein